MDLETRKATSTVFDLATKHSTDFDETSAQTKKTQSSSNAGKSDTQTDGRMLDIFGAEAATDSLTETALVKDGSRARMGSEGPEGSSIGSWSVH